MSPIILGVISFFPSPPRADGVRGRGGVGRHNLTQGSNPVLGYVAPAGLNSFFSLDIAQGDRAHALS